MNFDTTSDEVKNNLADIGLKFLKKAVTRECLCYSRVYYPGFKDTKNYEKAIIHYLHT